MLAEAARGSSKGLTFRRVNTVPGSKALFAQRNTVNKRPTPLADSRRAAKRPAASQEKGRQRGRGCVTRRAAAGGKGDMMSTGICAAYVPRREKTSTTGYCQPSLLPPAARKAARG
ncbi:unnamed protein product [Pleuronectes platessa]|uniref:Uncharacterized protein n=1 Tax=Pleuronectes platessa TaxID=8262 RepID=A0A9N7Y9Y6_PLEPL|nr:unnamed protein product [Pleuronectes platessa]